MFLFIIFEVVDDWLCPECGVGKEDFDMVEI